jgi:hypothetical protein
LANCWEAAADKLSHGLPKEIADVLRTDESEPTLLVALPEHKIPLPGSAGAPSQSDLFALIRVGPRTIAATIEGKVDEPFGPQLGEWIVDASSATLDAWRRYAYQSGISDSDDMSAKRKAFGRAHAALANGNHVGAWNEWRWIIP